MRRERRRDCVRGKDCSQQSYYISSVHGGRCTYAAGAQAQGRTQVEQRRSSCRGVESGHLNNGRNMWVRWFYYAA